MAALKTLDRSGGLPHSAARSPAPRHKGGRMADPTHHDVLERGLLFALVVVLLFALAPTAHCLAATVFSALVATLGGAS